jgi:predicted DNA-binding transcriptional regulator AlpA
MRRDPRSILPLTADPPAATAVVPPLPIEPLIDRGTLASILSVSLRSLDRMAAAGHLPKPDLHIGVRQPRWRAETVRRWIEGGCR